MNHTLKPKDTKSAQQFGGQETEWSNCSNEKLSCSMKRYEIWEDYIYERVGSGGQCKYRHKEFHGNLNSNSAVHGREKYLAQTKAMYWNHQLTHTEHSLGKELKVRGINLTHVGQHGTRCL